MEYQSIHLAASLFVGLAGAAAGWWTISILSQPRLVDPAQGAFEDTRREELRAASAIYRRFEPLVDEWAAWARRHNPGQAPTVRCHLTAAGDPARWDGAEYVACCRVCGLLGACVCFLGGQLFMSASSAAFLAAMVFVLMPIWQLRQLAKRARRRLSMIKRRLPSALELMSLTMEVGASFPEAMRAVVAENENHPLGEELGRVAKALGRGQTRREAFEALGNRLVDDDVAEFIYAVVKGEELGSPLAAILRNQADQLRAKRSQWAERASEEAQVSIVFPGMLIMVACLLVVAAPFVLTAVQEYSKH